MSYKIKQDTYETGYSDDVKRIQEALKENGCIANFSEAYHLWRIFSEDYYAAGWLVLPETNKQIFENLKIYLEKEK